MEALRGVDARGSARERSSEMPPRFYRSEAYDYLVLSDVHLGSDLVPHVRPWARDSWLNDAPEVDARLAGLLAHYAARAERCARQLCLIVAGDFLDLVGVSLSADVRSTKTRLTREEQRHGLGSAHDHVVQKIEAIAARHVRAFAALSDFIARGHRLVVVRGNHDIELHWRAAQRALISTLSRHATDEETRHQIENRVMICPWFFAVDGLLYVEHGHEFDAMCAYGDPLLPTCPRDSRRIRQSPFAVMLRYVARPTRGLSSRSYENVGMSAYLRLMLNLGLSGTLGIAVRFARAVSSLLGECHAQARGDGSVRALRTKLQRERFAKLADVPVSMLLELKKLYALPAACSLRFVLRSLYLDRVLAIGAAFLCVALGAYLARYRALLDGALYLLPAGMLTAFACFSPSRDLAPTRRMRKGAAVIARMFNARYVVMGHTHEAEKRALGHDATYVNVGHWGEDDVPEERIEHVTTPCTFLWLAAENGYSAELLRWDDGFGPRLVIETREEGSSQGVAGMLPKAV
jgi:UDP-2,3-diacylglucosamine pyrophosphatase LpxH